ncbi:MAG: hypothetical protein WAM66_09745 [Acidobacteriaceae bacterium]
MSSPIAFGNEGNTALQQAETAALKKVVFHSFEVSPQQVPVGGGSVTVSWDVTIPTVQEVKFAIALSLNGQPVAATGTKVISVQQQMAITLTAAITDAPGASITLAQRIVEIDTSNCKSETLPPTIVTTPLFTAFSKAFSSNNQFSLTPSGVIVTPGNGIVTITVPAKIDVNDWFDANMTVTVQIAISGGTQLSVTAPVVNCDVSWGLGSNLLSAGCTDFVGSGMTRISTVFLNMIVNNEVLPPIRDGINSLITSFLTSLDQGQINPTGFAFNPTGYALHSITFNEDGLTFMACPQRQVVSRP